MGNNLRVLSDTQKDVLASTMAYRIRFDEHDLDEFVTDEKTGEAADINNGGTSSQIRYLLDQGYTPEQIIESAAKGRKTNSIETLKEVMATVAALS